MNSEEFVSEASEEESLLQDDGAFYLLKGSKEAAAQQVEPVQFVQALIEEVRELTKECQTSLRDNAMLSYCGDEVERARSVEGFMTSLIECIAGRCSKLTAVVERYHVDQTHRDMYYHYYSRKHFDAGRFSIRVSFFEAALDARLFIQLPDDPLQTSYLGSVVLNPFGAGMVGRTLLNPSLLVNEPCRLRLSSYKVTIRGRRLRVEAFPFRQQDGEYMRCAEVSLLNLFCYYSNEFREYQVVLPSDISRAAGEFASQRVTPSRGLDYSSMSRIVRQFGFHPRLYNRKTTGVLYAGAKGDDTARSGRSTGHTFDELLYWYIRSGIPVAVNTGTGERFRETHSVICIGYSNDPRVWDDESIAQIRRHPSEYRNERGEVESSCLLMSAAAFPRRYYVVDDNKEPYYLSEAVSPLASKANADNVRHSLNYLVCLPQGMALDPLDAYSQA